MDCTVVVIGGAFSGASFALLLRRWCPAASVLVIERSAESTRKVGEATVEVSAFFLHRVLGCYDLLSREHLPKHGLRYWHTDGEDERTLDDMSETGPAEVPRLPSFQLDRSRLDPALLARAQQEGTRVARPARVDAVEHGWPRSTVRWTDAAGARHATTCRWVIDASGKHAFLARRLRLQTREERHPVAAVWGRWTGVADLDGPEILGPDLAYPLLPEIAAARRLGTNQFCGDGWWCWVIPLAGGETSIGVVYDKTRYELPGTERDRFVRYERFLRTQPGLRELVADAALDPGDRMAYGHVSYRTSQYIDRGWALLGDAASFIDPYYSPGLDHASITIYATARLVADDLLCALDDDVLAARVAQHDARFLRSYERWFDGLYRGKYEILGDAELTACAFVFDTAMYYLGVVTPIYRDVESLAHPPFGLELPQATVAYRTMRFFNRRMQRIAAVRRRYGVYGRRNVGRRQLDGTPGLGREAVGMLRRGLRLWLGLELHALGLRLGFGRGAAQPSGPQQAAAAPS
ncbi:MAG: FAD-dependent monooxygenase [Acidobacteriota bacterium]